MSHQPRVLIVGCGDLGSCLGLQLHQQGWQVYGLRRNPEQLPAGIQAVAGDISQPSCPAQWLQGPLDYLVYAVSASSQSPEDYQKAYPEGLQQVLAWLSERQQRPKRLIFVSSTGVYPQQDGSWIDEHSPTAGLTANTQALLSAEQTALHSGHPATVVRLAGLYGEGRNWLVRQVQQGCMPEAEPPLYSNRIHLEDAANLVAYLLLKDHEGIPLDDCYLGVDDAPAPLYEVCQWLARHMALPAQAQPQPLTRRAGSKRCSNARLKALGWKPQYPSYQQGYIRLMPF